MIDPSLINIIFNISRLIMQYLPVRRKAIMLVESVTPLSGIITIVYINI